MSFTWSVPSINALSISYLMTMWRGYVTSSLSTRISEGSVISLRRACSARGVASGPFSSGIVSRILESRYGMHGSLRATIRSHSSDWLSWTPIERAALTGRPSYPRFRPCSYRACPVSWIVAIMPSRMSSSLYRDVIRTSVGWELLVKGCTLTSMRPLEKSKPISCDTLRLSSDCFSLLMLAERKVLAGFLPLLSSSRRGIRPAFISANTSSMRAAVIPGSNSSSRTSYAGRLGSIIAAFRLERSTHCSRNGSNLLKSDSFLASTHACMAALSSSAACWASSFVTEAFRLYSLAAR
mmetsp:Transcript_9150/g.22049  ORF Transcript_9150/g.22049 Transcript_9150/m.22049 type:complete len:296 (-) Transcript_9150:366-1253(-)